MYVRTLGEEETTLGVSGALWRDALVMYDRKTGSYWSQIDGRALSGPAKGRTLEEIPSVMTTWGEWKALHPETLVLKPGVRSGGGSRYDGYFRDPERMGVLGTENPDERLPGKSLVLGIHRGGRASALPLEGLAKRWPLHLDLQGEPILAVATSEDDGRLFVRRAGDRVLDFTLSPEGRLTDRQTGSTWNPVHGLALEGPLEGTVLEPVPARRVYWFVWARFNPGTRVLNPDR